MLVTKSDLMERLVNIGQKIANDERTPLNVIAQYVQACGEQFPELNQDDLKALLYLIVRMK